MMVLGHTACGAVKATIAGEPVPLPSHGVANGRRMFETWYQMESLLLSGRLELDEIITHEIPMEDFAKGFALMQSGEGIKIVMNMGG